MKILLWAERLKLKRSKILWITVFSAAMVAIIVFMQGQFLYNGQRYVDQVGWYMNATQSLGSLYVFPAIIALMGSYIICREDQDDTMKSLALVPVDLSKLVGAKMIVIAIFAVSIYAFVYIITLVVEVALHISLLDLGTVLDFAKIYFLEGIGLFLAISPIIAIVYRLKKGYWLALIFTEIYSFMGLFMGMQSTLRFVYPITAVFCVSGYYESTPVQFVISMLSLSVCGTLSLMILRGLNKKHSM
ncbi:ABC transporter permease [Proteiniborus sp. MB09-C3]|uniref:ABC transporter permease n=1 Tax=Proteiniborus sp. MB09-C3 TaxID=3050072 RepID=UPI0025537F34|nr:ABC transporter permease [Proteiniborus sp. MB09-C3]WIV11874.1 ABC transporter permease [Proteiniborus sp. MB09-C3]